MKWVVARCDLAGQHILEVTTRSQPSCPLKGQLHSSILGWYERQETCLCFCARGL